MTTEKTSFMLLAVICLAGIALAIAQPASVSSDGTVSSVNITAWYPLDETINDIEGATRAFNVSTNQPVTVSWLLNGTEVFNQSGVNISGYTATAVAGYCNVTAYAYNQNSSDMRTWRWSVSANDTTPPAVISHAPAGTKVSVKADVTATFNEAVNPVSMNNATIIVCDSSGSTVTGLITYDPETYMVSFDLVSELEYNETYNVTITTGVQDLAGNNMSLDFCWHFTTRTEILRIPIVISGYVTKNGTRVLNPVVTITNLDTGKNFATVETHPNSSYYRMWTDSTHVSAGDTLRFSVSSGEIVIDRNVTEAEIENGGFRQDLPGMPDLVITNITFGDVVNETFNINFTVENIGNEDASESNASIYIEYSTGIAMLNYSIKPLAPSENRTFTVGPFSCPCRDIKICVDSDDALAELNDTNNCFETRSPCPLPNLGPSEYGSFIDESGKRRKRLELCEFNSDDGIFNIYYRICNNGQNESPASTATINIMTIANNGSVVSCDVVNDSIPPLSSGGYKLRTLGPFPYLCNHTVNVTICADGYNEILEISERDNCLNETYYPVCTKPDLRIVHFSGTWLNQTNRVFNITYTVKNCGDTTANASTTRISNTGFYCRPSDVMFDPVPVLAPHASCARTVGPFTRLCQGPAPDTDPARYSSKLQIYADCNNTVSESETGEANNERVFLFGLPYLNIDLCWGHWVDGKNKTFRVEYRVVNEGGLSGKSSNEGTVRAYIDGNLCNVTETVPPMSVGGWRHDRWGIGPLPIPADKDTIKYKLCIVLEDGKEKCTPEVAFGGGGCIAEDGTPFTFGGAWGGVATGAVSITKSCTFNGDIYYPLGICIGADNIVIDGNGFGLSGARSGCTGHVIYDSVGRIYVYRGKSGVRNYVHSGNRGFRGYDNVTIKNMNIRNFCDGIAVVNADNNRIKNCSVHDNGLEEYTYGINVVNSDNTTIDMCEVYNNTGNNFTIAMVCGGHGINFHDDCNYCAVTNSHVFHNYLSGILATPTCKYLYIANNIIEENGYCNESGFCAGINLHWKGGFGQITNSTVEHNVIRNNTGPGIYVTQGYTTLTNNLVSRSKNGTNVTGNGIFVDGGRVTYLHNNTCCENDGTDIFDRGFTTYGDDNTCNTTFDYDDEGTFGCNFYCRGENGACVGATRTFRCGDFVTESCTFNRSMSCRGGAGDGLVVGADDVTIDGAGYALTGNYTGIGIISNHTNVTITNLQVEDFSTGMNIGNANTTVATCVVRTNLVTGLNVSANNGTVRNNLIYDNAGPGIFVDGINSTFVNNTVARNKGYGIYFSPDARGNNLTANFFGDNEGMEIYNDNGASNTGYNNTCDMAYNYNDTGMTDYNCTYAWTMPDLVISDKHENWVDEKSARYSVTYTVDNIGKPNSRPADSSTTYLSINYAFTATDGVSSLNASANYSSTFGYTPEMKEDKDTIKVCADGADAVKENNEADTYYYNDIMSEYYNLAGFFADKEANNCLENVLSKCGTIYDWDADAACRAADGTEYRCGDQDKRIVLKSCTFTGNMKCPSGHGLIVGGSGIRIDGKDFVIGRDESASSCASVTESNPGGGDCGILNTEHNNVEITNLEIVHFCNGIGIQGSKAKPINGNIIERCKIHDNGNPTGKSHGIHMVCVKDTKIRNKNEIYNNRGTGVSCGDGGNGIFLYAGGIGTANNVISGNSLHDNARAGFWTKQGMQGSTINDNKVWGNSRGSGLGGMTGGIVLQCVQSNSNRIEGNEVWDNAGRCGLFIGGDGNTLSNNNVQDNKGDGIYMGRNDGSKDNELNGNTVCDNEDMDIRTCGMDYGNTGADNYCDTTDNYADTNAPEGSKCAKKCSTVPKPDLEITGKNETWIVEGKSYKVTYTVRNIGTVAANASTTRIQIINGDPKTHTIPALVPAESETYEDGPFNMSGDSDMIEVCVDCEGLVEKYGLDSRANNCLTNTWSALPDLIVTEILLPDRLSFGTSNLITARIKNAGTVRTNKTFRVALFIVPSAVVPIDTASAQSELTAGSDTLVKLSWTPSAPGKYTLKVVADWVSDRHEGEIHESNEGNNEKLLTITEGTLGLELPEGPIRGGGGGGGGATKNTETIDVPGADAGEISTGAATKEVPVNESKTVKEEQKMGTGHPFGEGETIETVKVVAPVLLVVALISIVVVLFYLGYRKEKKVYRRRR